jgi:hypothetical protein
MLAARTSGGGAQGCARESRAGHASDKLNGDKPWWRTEAWAAVRVSCVFMFAWHATPGILNDRQTAQTRHTFSAVAVCVQFYCIRNRKDTSHATRDVFDNRVVSSLHYCAAYNYCCVSSTTVRLEFNYLVVSPQMNGLNFWQCAFTGRTRCMCST